MVSLPSSSTTHHAFISHGDVLVRKRDEKGSDRERKKKRRGEEKGIHTFEPCGWSYSFAMAHGRW